MWTTRRRLLGVLTTMILLTAACGSDDDTTTNETTTAEATSSTNTDAAHDDGHDDDGHDDDGHDDDDGHGHGDTLDVDPDNPIPGVAIEVTETDVAGTYDLEVTLTDFTVTPDAVDGEPVANEGHMHLLVDGAKVERFFDTSHRIELEPGERVVEVELNANDHRPWSVDGARINATQLVEVPGDVDPDPGDVTADVTIDVAVVAGELEVSGGDRIEIPLGSVVAMTLNADVATDLHVHGYDLHLIVPGSGTEAEATFTADIAGRFEVELEGSGTFVTELVVS